MVLWPELTRYQTLQTDSAETRLKSVRTKIALCHTLCNTVEIAFACERHDQARRLIGEIDHFHQWLSHHAAMPGYVPSHGQQEIVGQVEMLGFRIAELRRKKVCSTKQPLS
jgi:hypothetical protein